MLAQGFFTRQERKAVPRGSRGTLDSKTLIRVRELGCTSCPLVKVYCKTHDMKPTGAKKPRVYVLGGAPSAEEDKVGKQFVDEAGARLRKQFPRGYEKWTRWNNTVRCCLPKNRNPLPLEVEHCRLSIEKDIEEAEPKVVLGVGGVPLSWRVGKGGITVWRGRPFPIRVGRHVCWYFPCMDPSFINRIVDSGERFEDIDALEWERTFNADIKQAVGIEWDAPRVEDPKGYYDGIEIISSTAAGLERLEKVFLAYELGRCVAVDIETSCLRPYDVKAAIEGLLCLSFSNGEDTIVIPISHPQAMWTSSQQKKVIWLIEQYMVSCELCVAHNAVFEMEWFQGIYGLPFLREVKWEDTMALAYVLDSRKGSLSLDYLVQLKFGFSLKSLSNLDRKALLSADYQTVLKYNGLDAKYTWRLYSSLIEEVIDTGLEDVYRMHLRRLPTIVGAQVAGIEIDFKEVGQIRHKLMTQEVELRAEIADTKEAGLFRKKRGRTFNPTSPDQVIMMFRDVLKRTEGVKRGGKYSTDKKVLKKINTGLARLILELRSATKLKSTYVDEFSEDGANVHCDGFVHTQYHSLFTSTGRLSSSDPNLQNFPMHTDKWLRRIVYAPKGYVMVSADYGQIEARVIGMASKDRVLCDAIWDRNDIHLDWAERVASASPSTYEKYDSDIEKLRTVIKNTLVFPAFYGSSESSIGSSLNLSHRVCNKIFTDFWSTFAGVKEWQERELELYRERGYVESLTGRRRLAPLSINMVLNTPIQGAASDIVLNAMDRLSEMSVREDKPALQAVMNIHDDLTFYVPKASLDETLETIVIEMLACEFDWVTLPISIELAIGPNWAELEDLNIFYSDELD